MLTRTILCTVLATGAMVGAATPPAPKLDELLARSGAYVRGLEEQMAMVVADEVYEQRVTESRRTARQTIRGEMVYWWLAEERVWISVRNVLRVNERPVPDSKDRLERALTTPNDTSALDTVVSRSARLQQLQLESARFDIGSVRRTTSNPTEALQYVVPENQAHFAFSREREENANGTKAWKLSFREQGRPTVTRYGGQDVPTYGAIWIRATDGAVVRTQRTTKISPPFTATVTVDFERDAKLAMWVPRRMQEQYGNYVSCRSDYSNYRRFETSGRIVPQ